MRMRGARSKAPPIPRYMDPLVGMMIARVAASCCHPAEAGIDPPKHPSFEMALGFAGVTGVLTSLGIGERRGQSVGSTPCQAGGAGGGAQLAARSAIRIQR